MVRHCEDEARGTDMVGIRLLRMARNDKRTLFRRLGNTEEAFSKPLTDW